MGRKGIRSAHVPWDGTQRKREVVVGIPSLGSEWFEPQFGHPSPGVLSGGDKAPWLVGGQLGLIGGLWGAWTPPVRSMCMLAWPQSRVEKDLLYMLPGFPGQPHCKPQSEPREHSGPHSLHTTEQHRAALDLGQLSTGSGAAKFLLLGKRIYQG